ncbi:hypothetical protein T492DRAFT_907994, partial [Pavlovales sp. CCMP2436]
RLSRIFSERAAAEPNTPSSSRTGLAGWASLQVDLPLHLPPAPHLPFSQQQPPSAAAAWTQAAAGVAPGGGRAQREREANKAAAAQEEEIAADGPVDGEFLCVVCQEVARQPRVRSHLLQGVPQHLARCQLELPPLPARSAETGGRVCRAGSEHGHLEPGSEQV